MAEESNTYPFYSEFRQIEGRVANEPRNIAKEGKVSCVVFNISSNYRNTYGEEGVFFYNVKVFGYLADNVLASLSKGDPVMVNGKVEGHYYENKDGEEAQGSTIIAASVGVPLRFCQVDIHRPDRSDRPSRAASDVDTEDYDEEEIPARSPRSSRRSSARRDDSGPSGRPRRRSAATKVEDMGDDLDDDF